MKYNQIRCFVRRGVELLVVPWDYDFTTEEYDGLFISNGPGDPAVMDKTVERLQKSLKKVKPQFWYLFRSSISKSYWCFHFEIEIW